MPRAREGCRALPAEGPGVVIREARAAQAIGPRSEASLHCGTAWDLRPELLNRFGPISVEVVLTLSTGRLKLTTFGSSTGS